MRVVHVWDRAGLPWASAPGCTGTVAVTVTVTVGAARRLLRGGHVERRAMRGAPARFQGVALPECVRRGPQRQLGMCVRLHRTKLVSNDFGYMYI